MTGPATISRLPAVAPRAVDPALRKAAEQFEAVFVRQIMGTMRSARLAEGVFDSSATDQFRELADARTAEGLARTGQFGIARMIEQQLQAAVRNNTAGPATSGAAGKGGSEP